MSDKFPGQSDQQENAVDQAVETPGSAHNSSRRSFAKAGVIAPVVLSVSARPAFANMCSVSGGGSPGSGQMQITCSGKTPGYWKTHPEEWSPLVEAGDGDIAGIESLGTGICSPTDNGPANSNCSVWLNDGTKFGDVFDGGDGLVADAKTGIITPTTVGGVTTYNVNPGDEGDYYVLAGETDIRMSMMQVLWLDKSTSLKGTVSVQYAFHLVAAFLNALKDPEGFGYNGLGIITLHETAMAGFPIPPGITDLEHLKDVLDYMNNRSEGGFEGPVPFPFAGTP